MDNKKKHAPSKRLLSQSASRDTSVRQAVTRSESPSASKARKVGRQVVSGEKEKTQVASKCKPKKVERQTVTCPSHQAQARRR